MIIRVGLSHKLSRIKVQGEDPATPGYDLRSVDTKLPRHGRFWATLLLRTTCIRSCCTWIASCVCVCVALFY